MKISLIKVFPKSYTLIDIDGYIGVSYDVKDLYKTKVEIESIELIVILRKLGRKIFNSLFNNNIQIFELGDTFDITVYNNEIFKNHNLYEEELCSFIDKNGLPFINQKQIEDYEECIWSQTSYIDYKTLTPLITSAITLYILEALRVKTDKGRLSKIYKSLDFKNNKDKVSKHLNDLLFMYGNYDNNDVITISFNRYDKISYNREVISFLNGVWNAYRNYVYSNFYSIKTCDYCGEYITEKDEIEYGNIHNYCLEEIKNKLILEIDKKLSKETSSKEKSKLEFMKEEYKKDKDSVYRRFKKRYYDKKSYDKKKYENI